MAYFGDGSNLSGVSGVPQGFIGMWYGATNAIPSGWALCDGSIVNGLQTPDLRDKFVVGASNSTGDTSYPGLSPNATGGQADATLVSHSHSVRIGQSEDAGDRTLAYHDDSSGFTNETGLVNPTGSTATNKNLPPYYALAYIMKT